MYKIILLPPFLMFNLAIFPSVIVLLLFRTKNIKDFKIELFKYCEITKEELLQIIN